MKILLIMFIFLSACGQSKDVLSFDNKLFLVTGQINNDLGNKEWYMTQNKGGSITLRDTSNDCGNALLLISRPSDDGYVSVDTTSSTGLDYCQPNGTDTCQIKLYALVGETKTFAIKCFNSNKQIIFHKFNSSF